jgi:hypothetical protein
MSDPQDMAEDLDDDVSAVEAVTADEMLLDDNDDEIDRDLSDELVDDQLGLVGDGSDPSPEEAALHLVEDA